MWSENRSMLLRQSWTDVSVLSYWSIPSRDVLQGSDGSLLGVVTHTAGHQWQVHPNSDGAPQPLYATGVSILLQKGALSLQMLVEGQSLWAAVDFRSAGSLSSFWRGEAMTSFLFFYLIVPVWAFKVHLTSEDWASMPVCYITVNSCNYKQLTVSSAVTEQLQCRWLFKEPNEMKNTIHNL